MKLKLKINRHTTSSELIQLGMLFTGLGLNSGAKVVSFSPPTDPAELDEPELTVVPPAEEASIDKAAGTEVPKRRRRTRAEIEAENAARSQVPAEPVGAEPGTVPEPEPEGKLYYWSHPESGSFGVVKTQKEILEKLAGDPCVEVIEREQYEKLIAGNDQPAPTPAATATDTAPAQAPAEPAPATESPSDGKTYTAAEVQQQATVVARTHGADLVKAKIAELGGARIADLNAEQVNTLGAYLFSVK